MVTDVVLLGTGTPRTEPGRSGPSTAVTVDGYPYIFDFGPGVGRQIADGYGAGISGLAMSGVNRAFLTHMHSDHTAGLADLMLTPWMFGRDVPLEVYGPQGTSAMVRSIAEAYALDVAKRLHSEPHAGVGHRMVGHDVVPGTVYRDDRVEVAAFAVRHGDWPDVCGPYPTLGYRVVTDDRRVVISGDTTAFDGMAAEYADCDVLVHEVYATAGLEARPAEWRIYHERSHTSGADLARVASDAQPGALVLTHQLLWEATEDQLVDEVASVYNGTLAYGRDLDVI